MSSILKALKKLESEKSQRDELSTAVASDILRGSRKNSRNPVIVATVCIVLVIAIAAIGYYTAIRLHTPAFSGNIPDNSSTTVIDGGAVPVTSPEPSPIILSATPVLPQLSGIVYQENPENRLAIINDLPVMEGTLVEGYQVKTIYPDRVMLSKSGSDYVLLLEQEQ